MGERPARRINLESVHNTTYRQRRWAEEAIAHALQYLADANKASRLTNCRCRFCEYLDRRVAGQAFTTSACGICGVEVGAGSTAVDIACLKCAEECSICRSCGADLHDRVSRRHLKKPVPGETSC